MLVPAEYWVDEGSCHKTLVWVALRVWAQGTAAGPGFVPNCPVPLFIPMKGYLCLGVEPGAGRAWMGRCAGGRRPAPRLGGSRAQRA